MPTIRGCPGDDAQRRAGEGAHGALEKKRDGLTATGGSTLQPRCREPIGTLSMGVCIRPGSWAAPPQRPRSSEGNAVPAPRRARTNPAQNCTVTGGTRSIEQRAGDDHRAGERRLVRTGTAEQSVRESDGAANLFGRLSRPYRPSAAPKGMTVTPMKDWSTENHGCLRLASISARDLEKRWMPASYLHP